MGTKHYAALLIASLILLFGPLIAMDHFDIWVPRTFRTVYDLLVPLAFLFSMIKLAICGSTASQTNGVGNRECRFRSGLRVLAAVFVAMIAVLHVGWFFSDEPYTLWFVLILFLALWCVVVATIPKVEWNDREITATTYLLRPKTHSWDALLRVKKPFFGNQTHLIFEGSGKARISEYYACHDEIVALAESKLNNA